MTTLPHSRRIQITDESDIILAQAVRAPVEPQCHQVRGNRLHLERQYQDHILPNHKADTDMDLHRQAPTGIQDNEEACTEATRHTLLRMGDIHLRFPMRNRCHLHRY